MKKIVGLLISLLLAVPAFADNCSKTLMPIFTAAQATELCTNFSQGLFTLNNLLVFTGTGDLVIRANTADASDTARFLITSGSTTSSARGANLQLNGNEFPSIGGAATLSAGDTTTGNVDLTIENASASIRFRDQTSGNLWTISDAGALTSDATLGGDLVFAGSGSTISVQGATATTACMGVATPNGTTPVAVTTSCAVSGARVFYTRVGAVTNMASISTTTAPSGTGFSFASTGASDTLASSVVYLIVKESA